MIAPSLCQSRGPKWWLCRGFRKRAFQNQVVGIPFNSDAPKVYFQVFFTSSLTRYHMFEIDIFTLIGLLAATCTTVSFLPQAIRVISTKQTRDISLGMYVIFSFGILFWLIYGISKADIPIISANLITLILSLMILVLKIKYK